MSLSTRSITGRKDMKILFMLTLSIALSTFSGFSGTQQRVEDAKAVAETGQKKVNPCAVARCQSGYHCVPLGEVAFCAKDRAEKCTVSCYGISSDMHGSCSDYASQLATHPKCTCFNS
jgi:hypothetical protein